MILHLIFPCIFVLRIIFYGRKFTHYLLSPNSYHLEKIRHFIFIALLCIFVLNNTEVHSVSIYKSQVYSILHIAVTPIIEQTVPFFLSLCKFLTHEEINLAYQSYQKMIFHNPSTFCYLHLLFYSLSRKMYLLHLYVVIFRQTGSYYILGMTDFP